MSATDIFFVCAQKSVVESIYTFNDEITALCAQATACDRRAGNLKPCVLLQQTRKRLAHANAYKRR